MAYPGAAIYSMDEVPVRKIEYETTDHYQLTRSFLNDREKFLKELFRE